MLKRALQTKPTAVTFALFFPFIFSLIFLLLITRPFFLSYFPHYVVGYDYFNEMFPLWAMTFSLVFIFLPSSLFHNIGFSLLASPFGGPTDSGALVILVLDGLLFYIMANQTSLLIRKSVVRSGIIMVGSVLTVFMLLSFVYAAMPNSWKYFMMRVSAGSVDGGL